jgi:peptidyl-prolyl cis-trans isomerase C
MSRRGEEGIFREVMKTTGRRNFVLAVLSLLVLAGPAAGARAEDSVAVVNRVVISRAEFDRHWPSFSRHGASPDDPATAAGSHAELKRRLVGSLIEKELLFQEAVRKGYRADDSSVDLEFARICRPFSSKAQIDDTLGRNGFTLDEYRDFLRRRLSVENFIKAEVAEKIAVTQDEIDSSYTAGEDRYHFPERIFVRHILVRLPSGAGQGMREAAHRKCEGLLTALLEGEDFAELAKKHSDCPSGAKGGDIGPVTRGRGDSSFEEAVFSLAPGDFSGVVETPYGFHIIKVEGTLAEGMVPREEVEDDLRAAIRRNKIDRALQERIETLKKTASVEITTNF